MLILNDKEPRGLGYYEIDQRAVEGLPPGTTRHFEADTYTCSHCQRVVVLNPARTRERYKCKGCQHHICDDCAAKRVAGGACKTFSQLADEVLEQGERRPESMIILP
jgi:hypothetical protein